MQRADPQPHGNVPDANELDRALVQRVAARDVRAFEMLYRQYRRRLARFVERLTRKCELIEEILDDTMLVVWAKAGQYSGTCQVSTWIFSIAYREALRALQRERRASRTLPEGEDSGCSAPSAEVDVIAWESRAWLRSAIGQLSVEQRAVVELTYFHGCGYHEIASIIGCPLNTVKTRMFHARRRLRTLLDAAGFDGQYDATVSL